MNRAFFIKYLREKIMAKFTNKIIAISLTGLIFGMGLHVSLAFGGQKLTTTVLPSPQKAPALPVSRPIPTFIPQRIPSAPPVSTNPSAPSEVPTFPNPTAVPPAQSNPGVQPAAQQTSFAPSIRETQQISILNNEFVSVQVETPISLPSIPKINPPELPSGPQNSQPNPKNQTAQ